MVAEYKRHTFVVCICAIFRHDDMRMYVTASNVVAPTAAVEVMTIKDGGAILMVMGGSAVTVVRIPMQRRIFYFFFIVVHVNVNVNVVVVIVPNSIYQNIHI